MTTVVFAEVIMLPKAIFFGRRFSCSRRCLHELVEFVDECDVIGHKAAEFCEITKNNGHYAVQGHLRSPILVPIESKHVISCVRIILTCVLGCTVSEISDIVDYW